MEISCIMGEGLILNTDFAIAPDGKSPPLFLSTECEAGLNSSSHQETSGEGGGHVGTEIRELQLLTCSPSPFKKKKKSNLESEKNESLTHTNTTPTKKGRKR